MFRILFTIILFLAGLAGLFFLGHLITLFIEKVFRIKIH